MSNMSYCRFRNTAGDLADCADNIDADLGIDEARARVRLIKLCQRIVDDYDLEQAELDVKRAARG